MPKHPEQDWNSDKLIVELDALEVDTLELVLERLDKLVEIEKIMDDVAFRSPAILGQDTPHVTADARKLIAAIIKPWMPGDGPGFDFVPGEADEADTPA